MANITDTNINDVFQVAASLSDSDYIYSYKTAAGETVRVTAAVLASYLANAMDLDVETATTDEINSLFND